MHRSPTFLFLYLPWVAGVVLVLVVIADPFYEAPADDSVYQTSLYPLSTPTNSLIELVSISPRFPGCKDLPDSDKCAGERLEDYIYSRVTYPASPSKEYDAGLVVISFVVRPSGKMAEITIMRDPGYGRGADALRIVRNMVKEDIRWEPATVNGRAVAQRVYLKIWYSNFRWVY